MTFVTTQTKLHAAGRNRAENPSQQKWRQIRIYDARENVNLTPFLLRYNDKFPYLSLSIGARSFASDPQHGLITCPCRQLKRVALNKHQGKEASLSKLRFREPLSPFGFDVLAKVNGGIMKLSRLLIGAILGVSLLAPFALSPVYAQPAFEPGLARAIEVQERHTDALMSTPGVVGTAVGHGANGRPAVVILVDMREVRGLPSTLDGVPVLVRKTGRIYARPKPCAQPPCGGGGGDSGGAPEPSRTDRWPRPVPIGISTGHPAITAGTIGARVRGGGSTYALSNNHVYADENQATIGDPVIQPGTADGGSSSADDIGTLADFQPIYLTCVCTFICFCPDTNTIDAAIASTTVLETSTPSDGYGVPKTEIIDPAIDMKVKKYGRTTGQTSGRITAINATVDVGYSTGIGRFVGQIIIEPGSFSAGGDSGSLIVVDGKGRNKADDRRPVGLLFAGSSFVTVANPIGAVLGRFGVTIDGE